MYNHALTLNKITELFHILQIPHSPVAHTIEIKPLDSDLITTKNLIPDTNAENFTDPPPLDILKRK